MAESHSIMMELQPTSAIKLEKYFSSKQEELGVDDEDMVVVYVVCVYERGSSDVVCRSKKFMRPSTTTTGQRHRASQTTGSQFSKNLGLHSSHAFSLGFS